MLSAGVLAREISTRVREPRLWTAPQDQEHKQLADSDSSDESDTAPVTFPGPTSSGSPRIPPK